MTYRDKDKAQSQTPLPTEIPSVSLAAELTEVLDMRRHTYDASQQALAMALRENRVKDECLEIAIEALNWYGHNCPVLLCSKAGEALDKIERHLAELEPERKAG